MARHAGNSWKEPVQSKDVADALCWFTQQRNGMLAAWRRWIEADGPKPMATVYEEMQSTSNAMRQLHELDIQRRAHERGKAGR